MTIVARVCRQHRSDRGVIALGLAYLAALDAIDVQLSERFYREPVRQHNLFMLSTQSADEINIAFLSDHIMGVAPADLDQRSPTGARRARSR